MNVERLRERQGKTLPATPAGTKPTAATAATPSGAKPGKQRFTLCCGHEKSLAELLNSACPACQRAARERKAAKKRQQRLINKPARLDQATGRLPNGAVYNKTYEADAETWTGTLTIPGFPVFQARASGSFTVERLLDQQYRQHLATVGSAP